jgi:hypothetical protein
MSQSILTQNYYKDKNNVDCLQKNQNTVLINSSNEQHGKKQT